MILRRGIPLRWRIALLIGVAVALFSIVAALTAYWVVRSSLIGDLQRALREDVARVALGYRQGDAGSVSSGAVSGGEAEPESVAGGAGVTGGAENGADGGAVSAGDFSAPPEGPTGSIIVQLYDAQGVLRAANNEMFEDAAFSLPPAEVTAALGGPRDWSGELGGREVQVALEPADFGVVAVLSRTNFIRAALTQISRALALTALVLILISAFIGYLVAATAIHPITKLAGFAAQLDPNNLHPIAYKGPNDEVGQLSRVLNDLISRLRASVDAQRTFLAETSHELRTPLTSLQGFLDRAVRRADPETERELFDARRIAGSMSRLVADLLQLSRGELVREVVPHLLDPYSDILKPVAEEFPGVLLEGQPGVVVVGDPDRLRQLVRNLTANAVRATGDPGKVTLRLEDGSERVVLAVEDSGPGIPPEALPHIFDKFYKGAGGGAGLGLAIAKQIAEVHGGNLSVESERGCGAVFRLELPGLAEEVGDAEEV